MCACVCVSIFPKCILAIILVIKGLSNIAKSSYFASQKLVNSHSLCIHSVTAPKLPPADVYVDSRGYMFKKENGNVYGNFSNTGSV